MNYQDLQTQAHEALEQLEATEYLDFYAYFTREDAIYFLQAVLELLEENQRLQRLLDAARFRADLPATSHGEDV